MNNEFNPLWLVVFLAHIVKSTTGFGAALISIPFLSHTYNLKYLIPLFALFDLYSGIFVVTRSKKRNIDYNTISYIVVGLVVGTALGTQVLAGIRNELLKKLFGVFIAVFALKSIFFDEVYIKRKSKILSVFSGFLGGLTGSLFGVNGPPIIIYLSYSIKDKLTLRNSLFAIFLVDAVWKSILFVENGLMTTKIFLDSLFLIPLIVFALLIGKRVNIGLPPRMINMLIGIILLINSYFLVFG